jgi:hypothetical protein
MESHNIQLLCTQFYVTDSLVLSHSSVRNFILVAAGTGLYYSPHFPVESYWVAPRLGSHMYPGEVCMSDVSVGSSTAPPAPPESQDTT